MLERLQPCQPGLDALREVAQIAGGCGLADRLVSRSKPIQGARGLLCSAEGIAPQGLDRVLEYIRGAGVDDDSLRTDRLAPLQDF